MPPTTGFFLPQILFEKMGVRVGVAMGMVVRVRSADTIALQCRPWRELVPCRRRPPCGRLVGVLLLLLPPERVLLWLTWKPSPFTVNLSECLWHMVPLSCSACLFPGLWAARDSSWLCWSLEPVEPSGSVRELLESGILGWSPDFITC